MDPFFQWIESSPLSVWIRESTSVLAFPAILSAHAIGMALAAGVNAAIALRLLGVGSVGETRAIGQSSRVFAGGQPLPMASVIVPRHVRSSRSGVLGRANPAPRAHSTAPWSTHALPPRLRYLLACPVATPCALVLVTEHLKA